MNIQTNESILNPILSSFSQYGSDPKESQAKIHQEGVTCYINPIRFLGLLEEVAAIEFETGHDDELIVLIGRVLDLARMDHEIEKMQGTNLLAETEKHLQRLAIVGKLTQLGAGIIAGAYARGGLPIPDALSFNTHYFSENMAIVAACDPSAFSDYVKEVLSEFIANNDVELVEFKRRYIEVVATIAEPSRSLFVKETVRQIHDRFAELGCLLLLENVENIRSAALEGLEDRLALGKWTVGIYRKLKVLRNWLTDSAVVERVDRLIAAAVEKDKTQFLKPPMSKIHAVKASILDSTGAQTMLASVQFGKSRYIVILTLKQEFGVKRISVKYCKSSNLQRKYFAIEDGQSTYFDVDPKYLKTAVGIALADGLKNGHTPNAELVEVAEITGLYDLQSIGEGNVDDVLTTVFSAEELNSVTDEEKRALIAKSADWIDLTDNFGTWKEQADAITNAVKNETSKEKQEELCWDFLEGRRDFWANKVAWIAVLASMAKESDLDGHTPLEFAVVAKEIFSGGDLREIPPMQDVVRLTIDHAGVFYLGV